MTFICRRCGYKTEVRTNFGKHLFRVSPCKPDLEDVPIEDLRAEFDATLPSEPKTCTHCNAEFPTPAALQNHKRSCNIGKLHGRLVELEARYTKLTQEIDAVRAEYRTLTQQNNPTPNINVSDNHGPVSVAVNSNNTENRYEIHLYNFNSPNVDYIPKSFLEWCFENHPDSIPRLIDGIFFNEEHPENHTIVKKNLNKGKVRCFENGEWIEKDMCNTFTTVHQMCNDIGVPELPPLPQPQQQLHPPHDEHHVAYLQAPYGHAQAPARPPHPRQARARGHRIPQARGRIALVKTTLFPNAPGRFCTHRKKGRAPICIGGAREIWQSNCARTSGG